MRWRRTLLAPPNLYRIFRLALTFNVLLFVCLPGTAMDFYRLQQSIQQRFGGEGASRVQQYQQHLSQWLTLTSDKEKLAQVNDFFNRNIQFDSDINLWKQPDFWATPGETLGLGAGDCEDFTIIKYFALKALGIPIQKLRLTYVRARIGGSSSNITVAHMVLTYYATPEAQPLVLDNLLNEIRPANRRPDLAPVFSFNSDGVWATGGQGSTPVEKLSRWTSLIERMHTEGSD